VVLQSSEGDFQNLRKHIPSCMQGDKTGGVNMFEDLKFGLLGIVATVYK